MPSPGEELAYFGRRALRESERLSFAEWFWDRSPYSVVADEWPVVERALASRVANRVT